MRAFAPTAAPWTVTVSRLSDNSINIVHVLGPEGQGLAQVGVYPNEDETLSNAHLFASASELLALAILFRGTVEYEIRRSRSDGDEEGARMKTITLNLIRQTITKATGSRDDAGPALKAARAL